VAINKREGVRERAGKWAHADARRRSFLLFQPNKKSTNKTFLLYTWQLFVFVFQQAKMIHAFIQKKKGERKGGKNFFHRFKRQTELFLRP